MRSCHYDKFGIRAQVFQPLAAELTPAAGPVQPENADPLPGMKPLRAGKLPLYPVARTLPPACNYTHYLMPRYQGERG
ncbi:hypothetical protein hamaS1_07780 [Moorella sp. Hama-1]|nr:hypothetical protein hamaS1_07780 [Moorella sp. Hama-1]